jgi:hypothetical protein
LYLTICILAKCLFDGYLIEKQWNKKTCDMNKPIIQGLFVHDIKLIIGQARAQAVRSVEFHRVEMYWKLGERIFEEEQQGKERADYGAYLIRNLAIVLEPEFGSGFSVRTLEQSRQFYLNFPIANAVHSQLRGSIESFSNLTAS